MWINSDRASSRSVGNEERNDKTCDDSLKQFAVAKGKNKRSWRDLKGGKPWIQWYTVQITAGGSHTIPTRQHPELGEETWCRRFAATISLFFLRTFFHEYDRNGDKIPSGVIFVR